MLGGPLKTTLILSPSLTPQPKGFVKNINKKLRFLLIYCPWVKIISDGAFTIQCPFIFTLPTFLPLFVKSCICAY